MDKCVDNSRHIGWIGQFTFHLVAIDDVYNRPDRVGVADIGLDKRVQVRFKHPDVVLWTPVNTFNDYI